MTRSFALCASLVVGLCITWSQQALAQSTAIVLHSQLGDADLDGLRSQNFETANDIFDASAADDFTVPANETWRIEELTADFIITGGPAASIDVTIYTDNVGSPDAVVCQELGGTATESAGRFTYTFATPCAVDAGTYWLSIVVNADTPNDYFWSSRNTTVGNPVVWQQLGDGSGTGCTVWTPYAPTCGTDIDSLIFELRGSSCGNGTTEYASGEECDDGDILAGDGCDDACLVEGAVVNRLDAIPPGSVGVASQNFETANDDLDADGADDFGVPNAHFYEINRVFAGGFDNGNPTVTTATIRFYDVNAGLPGTLVTADVEGNSCEYTSVAVAYHAGFVIADLPTDCILGEGSYFVSVVVDKDDADGQWFWFLRDGVAGNQMAWQNPGDGFGSGCTSWGTVDGCLGEGIRDAMFALGGVDAFCGDGTTQAYAGETCDDGNNTDNDGCSAECLDEGAGGGGGGGPTTTTGAGGMGPAGPGSGPTTGPTGAGGATNATSTGAGASSNEEDDGADDDSGCGCRTVGHSGDGGASLILLAGVGLFLTRRRR